MLGAISATQTALAAWLAIACALVTLYCTGMIYASLPTIRAWQHPLVAPVYIVLALATGGVLLTALLAAFGRDARWAGAGDDAGARCRMAAQAPLLDRHRHRASGPTPRKPRPGSAHLGTVRPLDPPHTQPNFVMREMGYQVARRHAEKLRSCPSRCCSWCRWRCRSAALPLPAFAQIILAAVAVLSAAVGVLVERWLFFAEAEHVVVLYYRGGSA